MQKIRHTFFLVVLLTAAATFCVGAYNVQAATGLFGTILYSKVNSGSASYTVPLDGSVKFIHITAAGGGSFYGRQNTDYADLAVSPGQIITVNVGAREVPGVYSCASLILYHNTSSVIARIWDFLIPSAIAGTYACPSGRSFDSWVTNQVPGQPTTVVSSGLAIVTSNGMSDNTAFYSAVLPQESGRDGYVIIEQTSQLGKTYYVPGIYTWTVPSGVTSFSVKVWGAGGGAGNSCPSGMYSPCGGPSPDSGGGGGGGYTTKTYSNVTSGAAFSIKVGQGGKGASDGTGNQTGISGDFSIFTSGSIPASCSGATQPCSAGGGGSQQSVAGTAGYGIGGDANYNGTSGQLGNLENNGGLAGGVSCNNPMYIDQITCTTGYQANHPQSGIAGQPAPGADNFSWSHAHEIYDNSGNPRGADTAGGDGYSPGNGGGNGDGISGGGTGGNGMVSILYTPPSSGSTSYLDVLRIRTSSGTVHLAGLADVTQSQLHIRKNGITYAVVLVPTTDANASAVHIMTSAGVKAIRTCTTANGCTVLP